MSIVDDARRRRIRQAKRHARLAQAQRSRRRTEVRRASSGRPPVCASATTTQHPRHVAAGITRGSAVAGPPLFVPPAGRREMARDGYRLLVRLRRLRRSIGARRTFGFYAECRRHSIRRMDCEYFL
ncbi:hypothetical protein [Burkholderia territorii]|uniref:hypothetical protein n=1 Tax=Burkholderia territorii TaxID=1503055 RepID=UPI000A8B01BB|nr:hypothetical protein [Burkholderia territorii]